ncbi:MAG: ribonuclease HII [Nanoarchaeota archaeon]
MGPMVMAGVLVEEKDLAKLESIGVTDSKLLKKEKRQELFSKIKKIVKSYKIVIIQPKEIDDALESDELNLNWLEAIKAAEIINNLRPEKVTVDSPSTNCKAYAQYLMNLLKNKNTVLECIHKADLKYVYVGAASILAKVVRDNEIEKIKEKYGDCGPGYPSNEITQRFLAANWEKYPEIFRRTWSTYKRYANMKHQKKLGDFSENDKIKELEALKDLGYKFVVTTSMYEAARLRGPATIVLYDSGKILIQGEDETAKKMLQRKGFLVSN